MNGAHRPPGSGVRPPTLADVAAAAGVSRALVSIVIRDVPGASAETRQRVLAVAAELGYRPDSRARLLAGHRTRLLGVTIALNNPFHADVVAGIYDAAEESGYQVVLSAVTDRRDARAAIDTLLDYRCDAALLVGPLLPSAALATLAKGLAVVVVGQPSRVAGTDVVRAADGDGVALAVDHLVGLGHRAVTYVDGLRAPAASERRRGYRDAMRRHGLAGVASVVAGGSSESDGAAVARRLAAGTLPTAVITYNDRSAVGLLDVFARLGIHVPGEVSVVGYDDTEQAGLDYRQLTTVSQQAEALARLATARAIARIEGAPAQGQHVLAPRLVVRGSTGAPA